MNLRDMHDTYNVLDRRIPVKGDLVYVPSQELVFTVVHTDGLRVKIERKHKGSGLFMTVPPSQYMIVEKKNPRKKK